MKLEVNLLPPEAYRTRTIEVRRLLVVLLLSVAGLGFLYAASLLYLKDAELRARVVRRETELSSLGPLLARVRALEAAEGIGAHQVAGSRLGQALAHLLALVPPGVSVGGVNYSPGNLTLTGSARSAEAFALFLQRLAARGGFGTPHLDRVAEASAGYTFQLSFQVLSPLPYPPSNPSTTPAGGAP